MAKAAKVQQKSELRVVPPAAKKAPSQRIQKGKKEVKYIKSPFNKQPGFITKLIRELYQKKFGKVPETAQESIPYKQIYRDGICKATDNLYSKTIQFFDINYQLAQQEDQKRIFEQFCDFLNYFESKIYVQFSYINMQVDNEETRNSIIIPEQKDSYAENRKEYSEILQNQFTKGNNGLEKKKYVTFSIDADNYAEAKMKLEQIEIRLVNNFKTMGVSTKSLTGQERLRLLHEIFNMGTGEKFRFSWNLLKETGNTTKDFIAPTSFEYGNKDYFRMGKQYGSVSSISILAPELNDKILSEVMNTQNNIILNIHVKSVDQLKAMKMIKKVISDIDKDKIEKQMKAARSGYDTDILPSEMKSSGEDAVKMLSDLQSRNERMFMITIIMLNIYPNKKVMENQKYEVGSIWQTYNCPMRNLDYQQEEGFISSLPMGINKINIKRQLTTSQTAILMPFTTQELFQHGETQYYGLNALSNNMIMASRKNLKNPNGLILGTPGSGKSFSAKREMLNVVLTTQDDVIICDPEAEYYPLVNELGGQVIKVSPTSKHYINPMDINMNYSEDEDPIKLKSDFIMSLCELIVGGNMGLTAIERSIIDRCLKRVYENYMNNPVPENMPILGDLYDTINAQEVNADIAQDIAAALELYISGSMNVFNHQTNVDISNRVVCFDIKELGKNLKKLGMLIVQDQVWNRVTVNRSEKKSTWYYVDEFHLLLKEAQTASYSVEIWKRFRKWGGIPTGITQNVKDLLKSEEIENIFDNSDFVLMLNQAPGDQSILAEKLNISDYQLNYVTDSSAGEGLIKFGGTIIPFVDKFPVDTRLYSLMTTKPEEMQNVVKAATA